MSKGNILYISISKSKLFVLLFISQCIAVVNINKTYTENVEKILDENNESNEAQKDNIEDNNTNNSDSKNNSNSDSKNNSNSDSKNNSNSDSKNNSNSNSKNTNNNILNNKDNDNDNDDDFPEDTLYTDNIYYKEYTKLFNEAYEDEKKDRYIDAIDKYETLLSKYLIFQNSIIVETKIHLARCSLKVDEYKKCKAYFLNILETYKPFPANVQETREQIIKELCEIIDSKVIYREDLDLTEAEELVKVINTYKKEIKNSKISEYINDLYKKVVMLIEKHQINYILFYFNNQQYTEALYICDLFLKKSYVFYKKEVCLLKLQILYRQCLDSTTNIFESRSNFIRFFDTIRKKYNHIYQENQNEFDEINEKFQKNVIDENKE